MEDPKVLERMRADWNQRAGEDANYYVAFGRREQDNEEFFSTGNDIAKTLELELKRLRGTGRRARNRLRTRTPDASHEPQLRRNPRRGRFRRNDPPGRERGYATLPSAHPHHSSGSDLAMFPDEKFDLVYSYAVFQHIPSREVVFNYLREARRVLKTGGILRCQLNGLPPHAKQYDTWSGVRISADEIARFAREQDMQLLVIEQIWTQYMWITCRKRPAGWTASLAVREAPRTSVIRSISNALTGEAVAPVRGPLAALSLWVHGLPDEADLNHHHGYRRRPRLPPDLHRRAGKGRHLTGQCGAARRRAYGHGAGGTRVARRAGGGGRLGADHARRTFGAAHHHHRRRHQPAFRNTYRDGHREGHHA